ncbi:MAG: acetolactate synthase small subunit [Candidatus Omnitrophica bacterium]|nr:acetolactate synthase small subunit [Candidatus Omnitrophota bacterium]
MNDKKMNIHTISMLVANKPGVLVRVALVFARRGYNIDSLVVSPSFDERYSRMTITAQGDPAILEQIIKQTAKLVDVIHSGEHTEAEALHRELALVKIKNVTANHSIVTKFIKKFNSAVIDQDEKALIVQLVGTTAELDEMEVFLKKYGMMEIVRSGKLVMVKGTQET